MMIELRQGSWCVSWSRSWEPSGNGPRLSSCKVPPLPLPPPCCDVLPPPPVMTYFLQQGYIAPKHPGTALPPGDQELIPEPKWDMILQTITVCLGKSWDKSQESGLSFHSVGLRNWLRFQAGWPTELSCWPTSVVLKEHGLQRQTTSKVFRIVPGIKRLFNKPLVLSFYESPNC